MQPVLDATAARYPAIRLKKLDVSEDIGAARALKILGTPTLIGKLEGKEVVRLAGRRPAEDIDRLFASLTAGDVPVVGASRTALVLRLGAGIALIAIGLATGPTWPLIAVGGGVGVYGLTGFLRRPIR